MASYTTLDLYQTAQYLSPAEDRRIEDMFQAVINSPFSPGLEPGVGVIGPCPSQCSTDGLYPVGIAEAPSVYATGPVIMIPSAGHSQLYESQLVPILAQPGDEYAHPVADWIFSCATPDIVLDNGVSAISFADKDMQQATLIPEPWNSPEYSDEGICPSGTLAVFPWLRSMAPDLHAHSSSVGMSTSAPYDPLPSSQPSYWGTSPLTTGQPDASWMPFTPTLFSVPIPLTPSSSSSLDANSPESSVQSVYSPVAWSSSDKEGVILPNDYSDGSDSDASSPVQAPPRLPSLTQRNAFKRAYKTLRSSSSLSSGLSASTPSLFSSSSDSDSPRRSIKRTSVASSAASKQPRASRTAPTIPRPPKQSPPRSVQVASDFKFPEVLPPNLACPIPGCHHVQKNMRMPDLMRHIQIHFGVIERVCCGVPKDVAYLYEATEEQIKAATYYPGLKVEMVGGCGTFFTRKDGYQRHLKDTCCCLADAKGEWHKVLEDERNRAPLERFSQATSHLSWANRAAKQPSSHTHDSA